MNQFSVSLQATNSTPTSERPTKLLIFVLRPIVTLIRLSQELPARPGRAFNPPRFTQMSQPSGRKERIPTESTNHCCLWVQKTTESKHCQNVIFTVFYRNEIRPFEKEKEKRRVWREQECEISKLLQFLGEFH